MARIRTIKPSFFESENVAVRTRVVKDAIPLSVRRELALRYGCPPGGFTDAPCAYCGRLGRIHWFRRRDERPSAWVWFAHEMDHVVPESKGGPTTAENLVLACRRCNRKKGDSP